MRERVRIKRTGSFLELDACGHVIKVASSARFQEAWKPLIQETRDFYLRECGRTLHSVYVRGSAAKGMAEEGVSDLDTICILRGPVDLNETARSTFLADMRVRYPFCLGVELELVPMAELVDPDPRGGRNVWLGIIRTNAACIAGEDLTPTIAPFSLNDMVGYSRNLQGNLEEELPRYLEEDRDDSEEISWSCRWAMRRILRAGFELGMFEEQRWTNDLYLCWESFARHYPERASLMRETLELALNPVGDATLIARHVAQWTPWIYNEIGAKLDV